MKAVIVTGPESTGKSTLAAHLSELLKGVYVPEYAREYISKVGNSYQYNDIIKIAEHQVANFNKIKKTEKSSFVLFDTHLIITKVWLQWRYKNYPSWIDDEIDNTQKALYLLCYPDLPWVADTLRENGGNARMKLYHQYKDELQTHNLNYTVIAGKDKERTQSALNAVIKYFDGKESFTN